MAMEAYELPKKGEGERVTLALSGRGALVARLLVAETSDLVLQLQLL